MKKKRLTPEEIIKKLREAEGVIAAGKGVEVAVRGRIKILHIFIWTSFQ